MNQSLRAAASLAYVGFEGMKTADEHAILLACLLTGTAATSTASLYFYKLSDAVQQHSESYSIMLGLADELITVRLRKGIDLAEFLSDWDKRMIRARRLAVSFDTTRIVTTADILKQFRQATDQQAPVGQAAGSGTSQQTNASPEDQQDTTATQRVDEIQRDHPETTDARLRTEQSDVQGGTGERTAVDTTRRQTGQEVTVGSGSPNGAARTAE